MPKLLIESGKTFGRAFEFDDDIVIGRGSTPDFALYDSTVSRQHAAVRRHGNTYHIYDLGSGNGTTVNGVGITGSTALANGDRIGLGAVSLEFILADGPDDSLIVPEVRFRESGQTGAQPVLDAMDAAQDVASLLTTVSSGRDSLEVTRQRLRVILEVSEAIGEMLDEESLLTLIVTKLFAVFPQAERGFIMLSEEGQDELRAKVALTRSGEPTEIAVSRTLVRDAIENRRGILSADAMSDERFSSSDTVAKLQLRSVVCVPMIARGDVFGIIHLDGSEKPFVKDDMAVLTAIARQAALSLSNARKHASLLKRRLLDADLLLARKIQSHFLPREPPRVPGYVFGEVYRSALDIGGDYYDFLSLPEERVGIALGDVSGKGVSAALCMAKLSSEARYLSAGKTDPAEILRMLNASLYRDFTEGMFVTLVFFALDVSRNRLFVANAGHLSPLLRRRNGAIEPLESKRSMPLGIAKNLELESSAYELEPGDTVFAFTDGLSEAFDRNENLFGDERISDALRKSKGTPQDVLERLLRSVETFQDGRPQSDDLTIVCFGPA
ncbi:MAG TPA: SpoIIE family protein phosphatase [Vicinamibacteria bacterium]|nr:SpoIIE family protein phosphatase [Vicinamibacteria bacterium]